MKYNTTTSAKGTTLTLDNLTKAINGEDKPTHFILSEEQQEILKKKYPTPKTRYICSWGNRSKLEKKMNEKDSV